MSKNMSKKIEWKNILIITQKELRDSLSNRWFLLFTLIFTGLSLSLSWMGLSGLKGYGLSGFGRTTASLINLVLLIVPLMGLTLGAISLAAEREKGTLLYLMSQPISWLEVLLGKFCGIGVSLLIALFLGFGLSGVLIAWYGGTTDVGSYLILTGLTSLLGLTSLAIGLFISSIAQRTSTAVGLALFIWLFLVVIGDLGLMGSALVLKLNIVQLFTLALLNPLEVFKIGAILSLRGNLEVLGPVGLYATRSFGSQLLPLLSGLFGVWIAVFLTLTSFTFKRRGVV